jgi:hypothetical protein
MRALANAGDDITGRWLARWLLIWLAAARLADMVDLAADLGSDYAKRRHEFRLARFAHRVSPEQYTAANAVIAAMLTTSVLFAASPMYCAP